jgi:hypothetical protein
MPGNEPHQTKFDVLFDHNRFHRTGELCAMRSLVVVERDQRYGSVSRTEGVPIRTFERRRAPIVAADSGYQQEQRRHDDELEFPSTH